MPGGILVNAREGVRANYLAQPMKVTRIEAVVPKRPLTDRFSMSIFPIGGMKLRFSFVMIAYLENLPVARRG
jgi:hypothetical protein